MKANYLSTSTVCSLFLFLSILLGKGALSLASNIESSPLSETSIVWVDQQKGDDQNPGTAERPVRTILKGVKLCPENGELAISSGTYDLNSTIVITKNMSIVGGYQEGQATPLKTRIQGSSGASLFVLDNAIVSLKNLELSGRASNSNEYSKAVLNIIQGKTTFTNVKIMAPDGVSGKNGREGINGIQGRQGSNGESKSGGSGASGHDSNYGGSGGWTNTGQKNKDWGFTCSTWGGVDDGYSGGPGDTRSYASGGKAYGRDNYNAWTPNRHSGKDGATGKSGSCGAKKAGRVKGVHQNFGFMNGSNYQFSNMNNYNHGEDGKNGGGGGGGGQGQSGINITYCKSSRSYPGGGGGGGGSGGMGAKGGEAGQLGVSSIAIYTEGATLTFVSNVRILTGNAGNGGSGGNGVIGGTGGTGGTGGNGAYGRGGKGGNGGNGGSSCGGSGGNGGSSIGILMKNATTIISGKAIYSLGNAGEGGKGGAAPSCAQSGEKGSNGLSKETFNLNR